MSSSGDQGGTYNRSRTGCTNCRLRYTRCVCTNPCIPQYPHLTNKCLESCHANRHLKCDDTQPSCARCMKRGAKCVRSVNVRFKHYSNLASPPSNPSSYKTSQYNFPSDQVWCSSGDALSFVDEGHGLQSVYESRSNSDSEEYIASNISGERERTEQISVNTAPALNSHLPDEHGTIDSAEIGSYSQSSNFQWSPGEDGQQEEAIPVVGGGAPGAETYKHPPLYQEASMWPVKDATEARLIRYFIEHVSRRFDLCDPDRHFALVVPCRAANCPPLMDAVFALSARYLSRITDFDEFVADLYYQRCLNSLVPMLNDPEALLNQDLFAAIVVLRTLEEVEVPLSGADSRTHLFGSHLFVSASTGKSPTSEIGASTGLTGLRRAAFLVAFRQEVYTAFVSQRPVMPSFYLYDIDRLVEVPADDSTWTNRILLHVADVLEFCFDDSSTTADISNKRYEGLVSYGEQWYANKPPSFNPIFYGNLQDVDKGDESHSTKISLDIWLLSDAVATGLLNYHLSRILLLAFDPRTPRLGPSRAKYLKRQNQEIKQEVKTLIGMANGNSGCAPHFVLACMGIALAGDRFEERWEQDELLSFLKKTEAVYAWSTSTAQEHLQEAWGWIDQGT